MARRRAAAGGVGALGVLCLLVAARAHGTHSLVEPVPEGATGRAALTGGDMALTWTLRGNESITFEVDARQPSFAAGIGLGCRSMVDCAAYVAWLDPASGAGHVISYWMDARRGDHVLPTREALSDVAVERRTDGSLSFRFTRPLAGAPAAAAGAAATPTLLRPLAPPLPVVWGLFPSWAVADVAVDHPVHDDMHTRWSRTPTLLNLERGTASGGDDGDAGRGLGRAVTAHAVLMALAWGLLFPGAAAAARHLRALGGPASFYAHVALNGVALVFLVAGFAAVYRHIGAEGEPHFRGGFHTRLGLAVFVLTWLQPAGGALRPAAPKDGEKVSSLRVAWEAAHRLLGRALLCLGALAAATGLALSAQHGAAPETAQAGLALWILWCVLALGGGGIALEMLRRRRLAAAAGGGAWARMGA